MKKSIKRIILMECSAIINYELENDPNDEIKEMKLEAKRNKVIIIGNANPIRYANFEITVNPRISGIDNLELSELITTG